MKRSVLSLAVAASAVALDQGKAILPNPEPPLPPPVIRVANLRSEEKPVIITTEAKIAADNGLFRRVETTFTFTNPNARIFAGELEFPIPDGATVCGYALEINGTMVPGVVVPKEQARVAFENETKKGVDPGLVEHVKGNVWKTRIFPLQPNTPRKAMVAYIVANENVSREMRVCEKFGDEIFMAAVPTYKLRAPLADRLRAAKEATIYWDASLSRRGQTAADRNLLECLPEKGAYTLVVFRNVIEAPLKFDSRAELLKAIDALVYDGGTCLDEVLKRVNEPSNLPTVQLSNFIFSDEYREPKPRTIRVRKLATGEKPETEPKEGTLLATAWAANRVEDLSEVSDSHTEELVAIGRKYGVASSVTSLLVLETLEQYKTYKIEPPKAMGFYDEWKEWRASEDDPIAAKRAKAEHEEQLLKYWEERVKWWNDPVPKREKPKSGLFDGIRNAFARRSVSADAAMSAPMSADVSVPNEAGMDVAMEAASESEPVVLQSLDGAAASAPMKARKAAGEAGSGVAPTVTLAAWDPKTPYLDAIKAAGKDGAYAEYLKQRETYGNSPAFFLDCAGWFFKAGDLKLGARIISNLTEMKLEDAGLWRTMAWRLREAGLYDEAIAAFRHALKMRPEENQSRRDLALVLTERGKAKNSAADLAEAAELFKSAVFEPSPRRSGRRGNDFQVSVIALEELNGLLAWCAANKAKIGAVKLPEIDPAYRRDLPLKLRIVMSWDADETDIDIHVLEPDGEEAFYQNRRTTSGGFVSEDVTTGYGPEEYLHKDLQKGVYKVLSNYYASHQTALTGATTVSATVYTDWATADEKMQILTLRLDKPKDKHLIGEVTLGD